MTALSRRSLAAGSILGLSATTITAASAAPADPVVALWAKAQAVNAELDRVDDQQEALRSRIDRRRPGCPKHGNFGEWHRGDPDLARCETLLDRSNELGSQSSSLYDQIAVAVAVTPAGVRAKAAAALSIWAQEKRLHAECAFSELIHNALREAAAGSAV